MTDEPVVAHTNFPLLSYKLVTAMNGMMDAFSAWVRTEEVSRNENFGGYVHGIAQARYVIRRVFRIVDDQASAAGLDPLEHQALLQVFGAGSNALTINGLAERLDIAPAFASRLVKELVRKDLLIRTRSSVDKRVANLSATASGEAKLRSIDQQVHTHIEYFQKQLTDDSRSAALVIFAFYLGIGSESPVGAFIRSSLLARTDEQPGPPVRRPRRNSSRSPDKRRNSSRSAGKQSAGQVGT